MLVLEPRAQANHAALSPDGGSGGESRPASREAGAAADATPAACKPATGLPVAATVTTPAGYKIDKTEVTRAQYAAWLATLPSLACQPAACRWNTSFEPDADCIKGQGEVPMSVCKTSCDNHPQVCVHWCDAHAYCQGIGKHLCGRIGGGALAYDEFADPTRSEWVSACSAGGTLAYSYGATYVEGTCNDFRLDRQTTVEVGSLAGCTAVTAGYEGLVNLIGNVSELMDACREATAAELDAAKQNGVTDTSDMQARCHLGSGSFTGTPTYSTCTADNKANRSLVLGNMGFRCCSN